MERIEIDPLKLMSWNTALYSLALAVMIKKRNLTTDQILMILAMQSHDVVTTYLEGDNDLRKYPITEESKMIVESMTEIYNKNLKAVDGLEDDEECKTFLKSFKAFISAF